MRKVKILLSDITYGPTTETLGKLEAMVWAEELKKMGYRKTSGAYCRVARIDRDDWLTVLAKERHCSVADFYNVNGSGVGNHNRDYYVRVHSKDRLTVHPEIVKLMNGW